MKCRTCLQEKSPEDFYFKNKSTGRRSTKCKACEIKTASEVSKRSYQDVLGKKRQNRELLMELKAKPCMDCGEFYPPVVMDFDHRDSATKTRGVTAMVGQKTETILAEVAKCDLVCANCHRIRTAKKLGWPEIYTLGPTYGTFSRIPLSTR